MISIFILSNNIYICVCVYYHFTISNFLKFIFITEKIQKQLFEHSIG